LDLDLSGEVAVVVGGASGIGRAIAEAFAAEQADVALFDVDARVESVAQEIGRSAGARTLGRTVDVTDYDAVKSANSDVFATWNRCDHLVVAAATGSGKFGFPFWNLEPSDWESVWRVNVLGTVHAVHAFAPYVVEARRGTILLVASVAGQIGSPTDPPYSASKAAVINFGQCAARDLAEYGVRVNILSPGMVQTSLNRAVWKAWHDRQPEAERQSYDDWATAKIQRGVPLRRWQEPADLASAAVFLASNRAKNVTGQTFNVDGGQVMHS